MLRTALPFLLASAVSCQADELRPEPVASTVTAAAGDRAPPAASAEPPEPDDEPPTPTPCPASMVQVDAFCIDRFEAHLRPLTDDGLGPRHPHQLRPNPDVRYAAVSRAGVFPQAYISREEAALACRAADKRLCHRSEWLRACRGTPVAATGRGGAGQAGRKVRPCNQGKTHLLTQLFGYDLDYETSFNSPQLNLTPGFLARTGEHDDCVSRAGVRDMVGNLHEWVSDTVTPAFLQAIDQETHRQFQYRRVGHGVFMGGFYSTTAELGPGCLFTTVAHDPGYHDYSTGFRCCRQAD